MSDPQSAVTGNRLGSAAMLGAIMLVLIGGHVVDLPLLLVSLCIGGAAGIFLAIKTTTLQIPQLVALFNGFGGGASMLVSVIILREQGNGLDAANLLTALLAVALGAATLSGSLIAAAKLDGRLRQQPVVLPGHRALSLAALACLTGLTVIAFVYGDLIFPLGLSIVLVSLWFGVLFTIRIGGADMPVVISLLNSLSGLAASVCGLAVKNILLVSVGAVVGASGLILTRIMCRAMNRSLLDLLTGVSSGTGKNTAEVEAQSKPSASDPAETGMSYGEALQKASSVVIVPGYGMALAQAQWKVKELYDLLQKKGTEVRFAIHPVAGRMPGHMNVLLAEVDIPYEKLCEMELINPEFKNTDVVIVVGACDVVNPAANTAAGTPIYGMPILNVHESACVIVCNRDDKPGYSGVDNSLYQKHNVTLLPGDAKETLDSIIKLFA